MKLDDIKKAAKHGSTQSLRHALYECALSYEKEELEKLFFSEIDAIFAVEPSEAGEI